MACRSRLGWKHPLPVPAVDDGQRLKAARLPVGMETRLHGIWDRCARELNAVRLPFGMETQELCIYNQPIKTFSKEKEPPALAQNTGGSPPLRERSTCTLTHLQTTPPRTIKIRASARATLVLPGGVCLHLALLPAPAPGARSARLWEYLELF